MASLLVLLLMLACAALASGLRLELTRIHSDRPVVHGRHLASSDVTYAAPTKKGQPNAGSYYVMTLSIGTPPVAYQVTPDTGSNNMLTLCGPSPLYDPSGSETFAALPCDSPLRLPGVCDDIDANATNGDATCPACTHNTTYAVGWAFATLGVETLTFGSPSTPADQQVAVPDIVFGCITDSSGGWAGGRNGIVGMGRGNLSLVSQLKSTKFSYCLTPFHDSESTSTLLLGPSAALSDTGTQAVRSTPFVRAPWSSYYYLNLTGISVGDKALPIAPDAFSLLPDAGGGGLIIDSGWTTTALVDAAYQQVRAEVLSRVDLPTVDAPETQLDLCFKLPSSEAALPDLPSMTFHFDGGADMELPVENYMYLGNSSGVWCLCLDSVSASHGSVLGNYQQQNMHILYDLDNEMLSFVPADCSTL